MRSESNLCNLAKMPYSILDLRYNNQNKLLRIRCKHRVKKGFVNADLLHKEIHQLNKLYSTNASSNRTNVFYLSLLLLLYSCVLIRASTSIPPEESTTIRAGYNNDNDGLALNKSLHLNKSDEITSFRKDEILQPSRVTRDVSHVPDEDDDSSYRDDEMDEYDLLINNKSAKGKYIGAPCNDLKCEASLVHVSCDKETLLCGCEKNYPVVLGLTKGCDKPKKLGEQCFYHETCIYNDENSLCVQVRHNARCQCANGFHSVSYTKPSRRVFCTQDIDELTSDLPTLLGVSTGIAVLAGLICMVLHLFSKTKYPRHRNFGDANLPPPIMYSSDTVQSGRPSSRSSMRSSGSIGSYGNRRSSSTMQSGSGGGSKGILVSTSRTGAARSAAILLISCHISAIRKNKSQSDNGGGGGGSGGSGGEGGGFGLNHDSTMTKYLQKQLNHQRQLLNLELSPAKNNNRIRQMLGINGINNRSDDDEMNSLENGSLQIGALPTPASDTPRFAVKSLPLLKIHENKFFFFS
ncbi:uncharacterized protein LOC129919809 isoform X2 [Episyrphus balteatus]|uniref:uncharacterized protein LOC129919809 isoform X2 n=1 Tax=Episyrphus balteatus TaxID=286459 RepID=UPI002485368D|nr:uncharacterized protein LOC129919809 isoform X2 [Episyrphus balteatus]